MTDSPVQNLADLARLRGSPELLPEIRNELRGELDQAMANASWFTIGVMAPSMEKAITALRSLEQSQQWEPLQLVDSPKEPGPVFLKANQKGGTIRIRIEHGLGEGILITGHGEDETTQSTTWGPLPLDFFS